MNMKNILIYTGLILGGLLLGYLFFGGTPGPQTVDEHVAANHTDEEGEIVYTCSMHPQVRESEPGDCPICGMELIPAEDMTGSVSENAVQFSNAALALAEIETTPARRGVPVLETRLPGKITVNQNLVSNVTAHFPGRVRELYVDYIGDYVRQGQKLASIYSPELITAQRELLETARFKDQNPRLYESSRRKLLLWEFPEETIDRIENSGEVMEELDFFSPVSGFVTQIQISREDHIREGSMLYRVAELSDVWVEFEAYESTVNQLGIGDEVRFIVSAIPGQSFTGKVQFIEPFLDENSRTVNVRVSADNPQNRMKPGMFAEGMVISRQAAEEQLLVPRSAVLWTGTRSIVFVDVSTADTPAFEAREVTLGVRSGDDYVIESGLEDGERVVTHGTFKVDAAAQLNDKLSMMNRTPGSGTNRGLHDHGNIDMETDQPADTTHQEHGQTTEHSHDEHLQLLVSHYLDIKNALTGDNFESATGAFTRFAEEVTSSEEMNQHEEHTGQHEAHHSAMQQAVGLAAEAENIEAFRLAFREISAQLLTAIENQGFDGTLYKQYCPMYEGGSSWISDREEIENPFYGSMMHRCGETVEIIQ
jgi:Cu(I)/Ag(I) efflux system membrane fusion protein